MCKREFHDFHGAAAFVRPLTGDTRVPPGNNINFASVGVIFDPDGPKLGPFCVEKKPTSGPFCTYAYPPC